MEHSGNAFIAASLHCEPCVKSICETLCLRAFVAKKIHANPFTDNTALPEPYTGLILKTSSTQRIPDCVVVSNFEMPINFLKIQTAIDCKLQTIPHVVTADEIQIDETDIFLSCRYTNPE